MTDKYIIIMFWAITLAGTFYLFLRYRKASRLAASGASVLKEKYENRISDLESEVKRQNFITAEYQRKFLSKSNEGLTEKEISTENIVVPPSQNEDIQDLLHDKRELEKEKTQFQEKTKKLWEQSLAIHKEKERIDGMRKEIEKNHLHVTDSIRYAKNIQQALLPPAQYLNQLLNDYFILYKPRDIVSGDFYWINTKDDRYLYVVAADCTGHGVPGALMSMLGMSFLSEIVNRQEVPDAAQILENLREKIIHSLHQHSGTFSLKDGMDIALCIIDRQKKEIQYAGAYNPLILVRNGELTEFKATKSPVAFYFEMLPFENYTIPYESGDCIYIFSDGYTDQFGGKFGRKFSIKAFRELLTKVSLPELTMPQIGSNLAETFDQWKGESQKQIDDVLVIGIRL